MSENTYLAMNDARKRSEPNSDVNLQSTIACFRASQHP